MGLQGKAFYKKNEKSRLEVTTSLEQGIIKTIEHYQQDLKNNSEYKAHIKCNIFDNSF